MDNEAAKRIHTLSNKIIAVLNDHQVGTVGEKMDALAYVAAWFVINVGGVNGVHEGKDVCMAAFDHFIAQLRPDDVAAAMQRHDKLAAAARRNEHCP